MQQTYGLERIGLMNPKVVYRNMSPAWLTEQALLNGEGVLSDTGALVVRTGKYTGRAPDDKFIVDTPSIHDYIAWNNINRPISKEKFNALKSKILAYFQNRPIYLFDGFAGADEHGWSPRGIFNFEGGCYAKCINLNPEKEPYIYNAIKAGTLVENVVLDEDTRHPNYFDSKITENTRAGYPIDYIPNAAQPGKGGIPTVIIFLTADSFGVLPPISRLSKEAAMYHFVTGFTSKVAGTEQGITEPIPTFSTLFGEPFMSLAPDIYAGMLGERIEKYNTKVYLVNTGWTGGPYGIGSRMDLKYTRAMITAALNGYLDDVPYRHDMRFNVDIPQVCPGVPNQILNPRATWDNKKSYDIMAKKVAAMFYENFKTKYPDMPEEIIQAGPRV